VGELLLWDAEHGECVNSLSGHGSVISRIAWSQDSKRLFSGGMTGVIRWWDAESGANLHTQQAHQGWIRSLSVSPDGSTLVSSGEDGIIHLWDIERAELIRTLRIDRPYERMEISGLRGVSEAQRAALIALGAVER
jgi:WD40 repeat protein